MEPDAIVLCLLLCFLLRVQAGGLVLAAGTGQNVCQGGPGHEEIISWWVSFCTKTWFSHRCEKTKCLEKLEESLSPSLHLASIPIHYIQLFICPSPFWNCQYSRFHLTHSWSYPKGCRTLCSSLETYTLLCANT